MKICVKKPRENLLGEYVLHNEAGTYAYTQATKQDQPSKLFCVSRQKSTLFILLAAFFLPSEDRVQHHACTHSDTHTHTHKCNKCPRKTVHVANTHGTASPNISAQNVSKKQTSFLVPFRARAARKNATTRIASLLVYTSATSATNAARATT